MLCDVALAAELPPAKPSTALSAITDIPPEQVREDVFASVGRTSSSSNVFGEFLRTAFHRLPICIGI